MKYFNKIKIIAIFLMIVGSFVLLSSFSLYIQQEELINKLLKGNAWPVLFLESIFFIIGVYILILSYNLWKLQEWARVFVFWFLLSSAPSVFIMSIFITYYYKGSLESIAALIILIIGYFWSHMSLILYFEKAKVLFGNYKLEKLESNANFIEIQKE